MFETPDGPRLAELDIHGIDAALHMGLDSMVERVRAAGGEVEIDSRPGGGTRVRVAVPTGPEPPPG